MLGGTVLRQYSVQVNLMKNENKLDVIIAKIAVNRFGVKRKVGNDSKLRGMTH